MAPIKNICRLFKITSVLYRRGGLFLLKDSGVMPNFLIEILSVFAIRSRSLNKGRRIRLILEELGPFFIKFGQTLATRADIVGEEVATELSELHDRLFPSQFNDIERYIEKELGASIKAMFRKFDKQPVATASIAAVFKAEDIDGNDVAVKVLKRNVEQQFAKDLELFFWLAHLLDNNFASLKRLKLVEVVKTFENTTQIEMDLRLEAAAASELKENHKHDHGVYIPKIYWDKTSKRVLTMEWVTGVPIYKVDELKSRGYNIDKVINNFTTMFLNQAYRDGFFHADLHPGNVFVTDNNKIVLIDFGIMGRLDKPTKHFLAEILHGFLTRNYNHIAKVHFAAGYVPPHKTTDNFAQACRAIGEPIVGRPANKISVGKLLSHLFKITKDFEMPVQPQLILIQKTTVVVEGLCIKLHPQTNMWQVAEPWVKEWSDKNLRFDAKIMNFMESNKGLLSLELRKFIEEGTHYFKTKNSLNKLSDQSFSLYRLWPLAAILIAALFYVYGH